MEDTWCCSNIRHSAIHFSQPKQNGHRNVGTDLEFITALMATHTGNGALQTSCHWLVNKWETQAKPQLFGGQFYLAFIVLTESVLCDTQASSFSTVMISEHYYLILCMLICLQGMFKLVRDIFPID